jgi:hypothetical protein
MKLVYIIENGNRHKKIGVTSDIQKRMAQLNTAISTGIRSVIISDFMPDAYTLEKQLHEANKEHRLNGEWFREIVDFCGIEFSYTNRNILKNKDFFFMFQQSLKLIASCEELNGTDLKVFMFMLSELDFENYIRVTQKRITEHTKIRQQHVSTALTKLTKLNIIEKVTLDNLKAYRLNPSYAWKGKISEFQKDEKERKQKAISEAKIIQLKQKMAAAEEPKIVPEEPQASPENEPQKPSD